MKIIIIENPLICTAQEGYEIDDKLEIIDVLIKEKNTDD